MHVLQVLRDLAVATTMPTARSNACVGGAQGPRVPGALGPRGQGSQGSKGPGAPGAQGPKVPGARGPGAPGPRVPNQTTLTHEGFLISEYTVVWGPRRYHFQVFCVVLFFRCFGVFHCFLIFSFFLEVSKVGDTHQNMAELDPDV